MKVHIQLEEDEVVDDWAELRRALETACEWMGLELTEITHVKELV